MFITRFRHPTRRRGSGCEPHGLVPFIEDVQPIGFAKVDADRPASRSFAIVTLEVPVDAVIGDFQRDAERSPSRNEIERRTGDSDQMPVVLATEIALDFAAVLRTFTIGFGSR